MKYILTFLLLCSGCFLTGRSNHSTEYVFPSNIHNICYEQMNAAKDCIQSKGTKLESKALKLTVKVRDGEKKFSSGWAWRAPEWKGMWVMGLTYETGLYEYEIVVACNPQNKQEIQPITIKHESGHFWLMSNYNEGSHLSKYKDCFMNWNDPAVKTMTVQDNSRKVVVDYIIEDK